MRFPPSSKLKITSTPKPKRAARFWPALNISTSATCVQLVMPPNPNAASCRRWRSLAILLVTMMKQLRVLHRKWCASPTPASAKALLRSARKPAKNSGSTAHARLRLRNIPMRSRSTKTSSFHSTAWASTPTASSGSTSSCRSKINCSW